MSQLPIREVKCRPFLLLSDTAAVACFVLRCAFAVMWVGPMERVVVWHLS